MRYYVYNLSSGQFLRGWPNPPPFDPLVEGLHEYPEHLRPDLRTERFDASSQTKKRAATAQELSDYDAAKQAEREQTQFDAEQLVKALAIWTAQKLDIPLATARQEILAILRGLG